MTRRYGLLGHPVAHSLSPALHNHWFARHGIDATYEAVSVDPAEAPRIAEVFRTSHLEGANLTVPFKEAVFGALHVVTPLAEATGSVNTVWWQDHELHGDTTDARGFVDALLATGPTDLESPALILGTGGAGIAVAAGLAERGVPLVHLLNRTVARAERAADRLSMSFPDTAFLAAPFEAFPGLAAQVAVVANCVSGPGRATVAALPTEDLVPELRWCDLNYWDSDPPLRADLGSRFTSGLPMLVHQAALAFERWTGVRPDPADLPEAVRAVHPGGETL